MLLSYIWATPRYIWISTKFTPIHLDKVVCVSLPIIIVVTILQCYLWFFTSVIQSSEIWNHFINQCVYFFPPPPWALNLISYFSYWWNCSWACMYNYLCCRTRKLFVQNFVSSYKWYSTMVPINITLITSSFIKGYRM